MNKITIQLHVETHYSQTVAHTNRFFLSLSLCVNNWINDLWNDDQNAFFSQKIARQQQRSIWWPREQSKCSLCVIPFKPNTSQPTPMTRQRERERERVKKKNYLKLLIVIIFFQKHHLSIFWHILFRPWNRFQVFVFSTERERINRAISSTRRLHSRKVMCVWADLNVQVFFMQKVSAFELPFSASDRAMAVRFCDYWWCRLYAFCCCRFMLWSIFM